MPKCPHHNLLLLPDQAPDLLRCRQCHLTISQAELGRGYCPECLEARGKRHADFERVQPQQACSVRYRCEDCGAVLEVQRD